MPAMLTNRSQDEEISPELFTTLHITKVSKDVSVNGISTESPSNCNNNELHKGKEVMTEPKEQGKYSV
jgi:hypothetical protein